MVIASEVIDLFKGKVKQLFIYITNRCQLRCQQCLYKPLLQAESNDIGFKQVSNLLEIFKTFGAYKLTFIGGEPTLYEDKSCNKNFSDLIWLGKKTGYTYIRFDTNGQFDNVFLENENIRTVDEITFSLDGHNNLLNDNVRGHGTFERCVQNIKQAVTLGYKVQITSCAHKLLVPDVDTGYKNIKSMIDFAESLGVKSINFHPILKVGIDRDNWIGDTAIEPLDWVNVYQKIEKEIKSNVYKTDVRMPRRFVQKEIYFADKSKYEYCPVKLRERALIMPNGTIKICAFLIGTNYSVAMYDNDNIITTEEDQNEICRLNNLSCNGGICANQTSANKDIIPLCMSYKSDQNEIVWKDVYYSTHEQS